MFSIGQHFFNCTIVIVESYTSGRLGWAHSVAQPSENSGFNEVYNDRLCEAVHMSMLLRHGARYPSDGSVEEINDIHERLKDGKSINVFPELETWTSPYTEPLASTLNAEGKEEHRLLGQRTALRFRRLFQRNGQYIRFISSDKQRTRASANSFYGGLYNATGDCLYGNQRCAPPTGIANIAPTNLTIDDKIIRFYDGCDKYENDIEDNDDYFKEFKKYEKTEEFLNITKSIRAKLGLPSGFALSSMSPEPNSFSQPMNHTREKPFDIYLTYTTVPQCTNAYAHCTDLLYIPADVYTLYELCAYDQYTLEPPSPPFWCRLLSNGDREILEYGQDLEKWLESMYGDPLTSRVACPLVRHMLGNLKAAMNTSWDYSNITQEQANRGYTAANFLFGHSETVAQLMATLGLYKDNTPLLATNREALRDRKFKSSKLLPFSANLAFVLYACKAGPNDDNPDNKFLVKMFVNEEVVRIPGCNADACPLDTMLQQYANITNSCDIEKICDDDDDDISGTSVIIINTTLADQKLVKSWSLRHGVTITSPVQWDKKQQKFMCVANYKSTLPIHELMVVDSEEAVILYSSGAIGPLSGLKQPPSPGPVTGTDAILWAQAAQLAGRVTVMYIAGNEGNMTLYVYSQTDDSWECTESKISPPKVGLVHVGDRLFVPCHTTLYVYQYQCEPSTLASLLGQTGAGEHTDTHTVPAHLHWEPNIKKAENHHWLMSNHMTQLVQRILGEKKFWANQELEQLIANNFIPISVLPALFECLAGRSEVSLVYRALMSLNNVPERCLCQALTFFLQVNDEKIPRFITSDAGNGVDTEDLDNKMDSEQNVERIDENVDDSDENDVSDNEESDEHEPEIDGEGDEGTGEQDSIVVADTKYKRWRAKYPIKKNRTYLRSVISEVIVTKRYTNLLPVNTSHLMLKIIRGIGRLFLGLHCRFCGFSHASNQKLVKSCLYAMELQLQSSTWDKNHKSLCVLQIIKKWLESMYGDPLTSRVACPLVRHMLGNLKAAMNTSWDYSNITQEQANRGYTAANFLFGHSETVAQLMATLGLYKDNTPLLATNREALRDRKFKSSKLLPFSANLAFVLYACKAGPNDDNPDNKFLVKMFVNEEVVRIPGCNADACPLDTMLQQYANITNSCDIEKICDDDDDDISGTSVIIINTTLADQKLVKSWSLRHGVTITSPVQWDKKQQKFMCVANYKSTLPIHELMVVDSEEAVILYSSGAIGPLSGLKQPPSPGPVTGTDAILWAQAAQLAGRVTVMYIAGNEGNMTLYVYSQTDDSWECTESKISPPKVGLVHVGDRLFVPCHTTLYVYQYQCEPSTLASLLGQTGAGEHTDTHTVPAHLHWEPNIKPQKEHVTKNPDKLLEKFQKAINKSSKAENHHWLMSNHMTQLVQRILGEKKFWANQELEQLIANNFIPISVLPALFECLAGRSEVSLVYRALMSLNNVPERCLCQALTFFLQVNDEKIPRFITSDAGNGVDTEDLDNKMDSEQNVERIDENVDDSDENDVSDNEESDEHEPEIDGEGDEGTGEQDSIVVADTKYKRWRAKYPIKKNRTYLLLLKYLCWLLENQSVISDRAHSPLTLAMVVDWLCLVLDAHITQFVLSPDCHVTILKLKSIITKQVLFFDGLVVLEALLEQMKAKRSLPQEKNIGHYCIEVLQIY
ncbi:MINP1-like protein [Mya arenaria]|uniref:Multiple inositol polyphosphate phosphatase 1 n=1 Tax=Mya arenaria TaxID=6604 RepID=A0ABY7DHL9_MYAAR|nr:MINP1-like protein [Mya arenaria]